MIKAKDLDYRDMRVAQREDVYFREQAKKKALINEMVEAVEKTKKMKNEMNEGFEKILKNWREKNGENS